MTDTGFTDVPDLNSNIYNGSINNSISGFVTAAISDAQLQTITDNFVPTSDPRLNLITDVTPGEATQDKALVTDSNQDLVLFRNLGFTGNLVMPYGTVPQSSLYWLYVHGQSSFPGIAFPDSLLVTDINNNLYNMGQFQTNSTMLISGQANLNAEGFILLELSYDDTTTTGKIFCVDRRLSGTAYPKRISFNDTVFVESDGSLTIGGSIVAPSGSLVIGQSLLSGGTLRILGKSAPFSSGTGLEIYYDSSAPAAKIICIDRSSSVKMPISFNDTAFVEADGSLSAYGNIISTNAIVSVGPLGTIFSTGCFMEYASSRGHVFAKDNIANITKPLLLNNDFYIRNTNEVFIGTPVNTPYGINQTIGKLNISYTGGPHISFFRQTNNREYYITLNTTGNLVFTSSVSTFTFSNDNFFTSGGDIKATAGIMATGALAHTTGNIGIFMDYSASQGRIYARNQTGNITMPILINTDFFLRSTNEVFIGSPVNTTYGPNGTIGKLNISYTAGPHISFFCQTNSREYHITLDSAGSLILTSPVSTFTFTNDSLFSSSGDIQAGSAVFALGALAHTSSGIGCFMEYASSRGHIFAKNLTGSVSMPLLLNNDFLIRDTDEVFIGSPINTPYGPNSTIGKLNISYTAGPHISLFNQTNNREYHITLDSAGSLILSSPLSTFTFTNDNSFYVSGDLQAGNALMALGALLHTTTATGCFIEYTSNQGHVFAKDLAGSANKALLLNNDFLIRSTDEVFIGSPVNTPYGPNGTIGKVNISYTAGPHISLFNQTNNREYHITLDSAGSLILSSPLSTFTFTNDNSFYVSGDIQAGAAVFALGALAHSSSGIGCFMEYVNSRGHIFAKNLTSSVSMPLLLNNDFLIRDTDEVFIGSPLNTPYGPNGTIGKVNISYTAGPHISLFNQTGDKEFHIALDSAGNLIFSSPLSTFTFTDDSLFSSNGDIQAANAIVALGASVRTNTIGCFMEYASNQGHIFAKDLAGSVAKALLLNDDFLIRATNEVFIGSPVNTPYGPNQTIGKVNISYTAGPHISLFNQTNSREYQITLNSTGSLVLSSPVSTFTFTNDSLFSSNGDIQAGAAIISLGALLHNTTGTGCFIEYASNRGHIFAKDLASSVSKALLLNNDFLIRDTDEIFIGSPLNTPYGPNGVIGKLNISYDSGPHISLFNQAGNKEFYITLESTGELAFSCLNATFVFSYDLNEFFSSGDIRANNALIANDALLSPGSTGCVVEYDTINDRGHILAKDYPNNLNKPLLLGNDFLIRATNEVFIGTPIDTPFGPNGLIGKLNISSETCHISLFNQNTGGTGQEFHLMLEGDGELTLTGSHSTFIFFDNGEFYGSGDIRADAAFSASGALLRTTGIGCFVEYASSQGHIFAKDLTGNVAKALLLNTDFLIRATNEVFIGSPVNTPYGPNQTIGKVNISYTAGPHVSLFNQTNSREYQITLNSAGSLILSSPVSTFTFTNDNTFSSGGSVKASTALLSLGAISAPEYATIGAGCFVEYVSSQGHIFAKDLAGNVAKALLLNDDFLIRATNEVFIGSPVNTPYGPNQTIGKVNISYTTGPHVSLFNQTNSREYQITLNSAGSLILSSPVSTFTFSNDSMFSSSGDIQAGTALIALGALAHLSGKGAFVHYKTSIARFEGYDYTLSTPIEMALGYNDAMRIRTDNSILIGIASLTTVAKVSIASSTANHLFLFNTATDNSYTRLTVATDGALTMSNHSNATTLESANVWTTDGNYSCAKNVITEAGGVHAYGISLPTLSTRGGGAHMHYGGGIAAFFGYNYSTSAWTDMTLGNNKIMIKGATGYIGIGTTSPSYPFHVANGTVNNTYTGSFGYVDNGGVGNGNNFSNRPFGAFFSTNVLIGPGVELNVTSDERLKQDIIPLDDESLSKFMELTPSTFRFKYQEPDDTKKHHGYRAQDVLSKQLHDLISITKSEEPLEEQDVECIDGSIFHLGSDCKLTVNMIDMIPLLHAVIQKQEERIKQNEKLIAELLSKK